jgi:peptide/nickel transport system substrate-binding protein
MKTKRLAIGALTALLGTSLVLSGCSTKSNEPADKGGKQAAQGPTVGGEFIYTSIGDAKTLIPILTQDTASSFVTGFVYDTLFNFDEKLQPYPALAEKVDIKDDKVYTFTLKKGVKFHDGVEMKADDVVFTFTAIAHPKYTGVRFSSFLGIVGWEELGKEYDKIRADLKDKKIDQAAADKAMMDAYNAFLAKGGIKKLDDYTVQFTLKEPFAPFFTSVNSYGIMPKHLLESKIDDLKNAPEATKPIGTGQMKFVSWVKDDTITLERNPDWKYGIAKAPVNISKLLIKTIPDQNSNMVALETGETDYATITPDSFDHFKNDVKHVNLFEYMSFSYTYMGYETKHPLFSDKDVRRALTMAINRQQIVDTLLKGHGKLAATHGTPVRWDFNDSVQPLPYDQAQAQKILESKGWKKGADGILEKDGQKFSFKLVTNNGNKLREQAAVIIQQELKKIGIDVKVELMEWNAFLDFVDSDKKEAYILGWSLGLDPDPYEIFHSKGGFQKDHNYSNPKVDELIEKGRKTTKQEERAQIYKEIQKILAEDQVYTWLYFSNTIAGVNNRIVGPKSGSPAAGVFWNFDEWYVGNNKTQ